ncbi:biotin transport system substrate-specific component [Methanobrevibacter gottschalkii]|uniref:Biotin transport system substrate-specific component n=2 Tax=Methanobrevibacter gottschalkii TaxID=190974 RepID=A0A3N5BX54_9EURY|nr:BioY protein [Methanobrevibacter sp. A27]RPF50445.1 biotin transport system substrate-specific component [Methanobrevibacter gottschalkii DSM 11977]SEK85756.1 biotin transport system substrate-specific component [Methanobrevibacter gottschalkii]
MNINIENYYSTRKNVFERIQDAGTATKVLMSLMMACFTGIMAQIIIPLPWTPVPVTAQTFAVLCSGLLLGKKYGCLSQILYVVLGVAFIPWFGGMTGGFETLLGSTGGFLIGFIIASCFIGTITEKYADARNFKKMAAVIGIANFSLIYIPGLLGLALWLNLTQGTSVGIVDLLMMGLVPFIAGDIVKILGAASVSKVFLPKE